MLIRQIFDPYLAQYAYLVGCQKTGEALIVDPERDIDRYKQLAKENGLRIVAVTETHIHADFVSGAQEFAADPSIRLYLSGEGGPDWEYSWPGRKENTTFLKNQEIFDIGKIQIKAIHTPGHTPEHISFLITDLGAGHNEPMMLVTGDFVFVGSVGRPDLLESAAGVKDVMEPSARALQKSLKETLKPFQDYLQILPGHGAGSSCGKSLGAVPTTTLGYERMFNGPLKLALTNENEFVKSILEGQPDPPLYFARMKQVNRDGINVTGGVPVVQKFDADQFLKERSKPGVKIIDTRSDRTQFDAAHVKNSINAPLKSSFFTAALGSFLEPEDRILIVIETKEDEDLAVRQLYRIGLDNVVGWITFEELRAQNAVSSQIKREIFLNFDATAAMKEGQIVDVRTSAEFQSGHLESAISIPYTRIKERKNLLPKDKKLYVHCASGVRSGLAASYLCSEGYDAVHVDGSLVLGK